MKGTVLDFNIQTNFGIIVGDDEQRYRFQGKDWMEANSPARGMKVDFALGEEATATEIYLQLGVVKTKPITNTASSESNGFVNFLKNYEKANTQVLKKTFDYSSRATRSEFWFFQLAIFLIMFVISLFMGDGSDTQDALLIIAILAIIPTISATVRRLHDTGRSGWWILISFLPIIGVIVLLVFMIQKTHPEANQWGEVPEPFAGQE